MKDGSRSRAHSSSERRTDVFPSVLGIDRLKVVCAWPDVVDGALRGVVDSVVVLLAKLEDTG